MDIKGLEQIVQSEQFCEVLNLPPESPVEFKLLGAGEYNINYSFRHPVTGATLVLRIPTGSQMGLENQIRYEYEALKLLASSGRTPAPLYVDDSRDIIPAGFLVMEFLPGRALCYQTDMKMAAQCLTDIHNVRPPQDNQLIRPDQPLTAIYAECSRMADVYLNDPSGDEAVKVLIRGMLRQGAGMLGRDMAKYGSRCIINTELNSGNFLVDEAARQCYLIDWEKPLLGYAGQDLGHFLAPTTTLWKTETILGQEQIFAFLADYCRGSEQYRDPELLWQHVLPYFTMTCLRGITWCSMAWVEYQQPDRMLKNSDTWEKINDYLSVDFLQRILSDYLGGNDGMR